jgi:hypothetical protein
LPAGASVAPSSTLATVGKVVGRIKPRTVLSQGPGLGIS